MGRKPLSSSPLTPAERQARKREARKLEAQEMAHRLERYTYILGSIARGASGKPLPGKDVQDRARAVLIQTGLDWRKAGRNDN